MKDRGKNVIIDDDPQNDFLDISVDDYEQADYPPKYIYNPWEATASGVQYQSTGQNVGYFVPENSAFENPTYPFERPYDCTYCQVLRNIIHTNGEGETTKFEIHGRIGMICHGILEIRSGDITAPNKEYHTFDFCKKSIPDVKKFLVQYFEDRAKAFYTIVNDPLQTFFDTLSVRSDWDYVLDDIYQGSPGNIGTNQSEAQSDEARPRKRTFREQRDFVPILKVKDLAPYFHLTLKEAAKRVGAGTTSIKNICRREKLAKWPFGDINRIEKSIRRITESMDPSDPSKMAEAEKEIQELQNEKARIYAPYQ